MKKNLTLIKNFKNIEYLKHGNERQKLAFYEIRHHGIFEILEKYNPILTGTIPIGIDLPESDLDIICECENHSEFKWNNYMSRYHRRHLDLMDTLAMFNGRNNASLNEICKIYGFPGKLDMDGGKVWETFLNGDLASIRNYCETDAANTYLVYLRYLLSKKELTSNAYEDEIDKFRNVISNYKKSHWDDFLKAWA